MSTPPLAARALWLVPGSAHPVFRRYADFFRSLFQGFDTVDYRAAYLQGGAPAVQVAVDTALARLAPQMVLYTQFPSTYAHLTPGFLAGLRPRTLVVGLGFDDEIYFEQAKFFYEHCDAVITTDISGAQRLRAANIAVYLAQLQQPHVTARPEPTSEDIDVSFVGDMSKPGRVGLVRSLEEAGIAVADYGAGSRNGRVSDQQVLDIFRRSRINLNFTRTNPPAWVLRNHPERAATGQMKGRPFELAALGRFCLCEWASCVEHWFRADQEIGVFRDARELTVQARRFLAEPGLRKRVAQAAHDRYLAQYQPERQFSTIFSSILALPVGASQPTSAGGNRLFLESVGRSKGVAFLHALRSAAPMRALTELSAGAASHPAYWRGFFGGAADALSSRLQRK